MSSCSATQGKFCPSRMHDGRAFTDYRPRCIVNAELLQNLRNNDMPVSSYDSRLYLQQNAESIIEKSMQNAYNNLLCPCKAYDDIAGIDTMEPERYVVRCNTTSCTRDEVNPLGIGDGRAY